MPNSQDVESKLFSPIPEDTSCLEIIKAKDMVNFKPYFQLNLTFSDHFDCFINHIFYYCQKLADY